MRRNPDWWNDLTGWQRALFLGVATATTLLLFNAAGWLVDSRADAMAGRLRADVLEA